MKLIRPFINLIFYGNFWIAACALAMVLQTNYLLSNSLQLDDYSIFVFFSTLMLYALHRIVGLNKVKPFTDRGRYFVIEKYKSHILLYALIGAIGAGLFFLFLSNKIKLLLILPVILSLGYVIPFLNNKRRLRDLNNIKIFLIALVWAWVTVFIPIQISEDVPMGNTSLILMFAERALFIFGITLPFDIRDLKVDKHTGVETLPIRLGLAKTKKVGAVIFFLAVLAAASNYYFGFYSFGSFLGLVLSCSVAQALLNKSAAIDEDYFFTGAVDGMMILQFLLVVFLNFVTLK